MNLKLLKELTQVHSVAGNEKDMEDFLVSFAKKNNLGFKLNSGYGVVIGNPKASIYCIAHIDEVGGIITKKDDENLKFKGIGRVNPSMFVGREIEIKTKNGQIIDGISIGPKPFRSDYKNFGDLKILVDKTDLKDIEKGDYLKYKSNFIEKKESIISTTLDNRVGIYVLLEYILINKNNKELFEKVAFCFATEEEIKNKGAIFFMKKYLPQNILIFDVFPECFIGKNYSTNVFIIKETPDYKLSSFYEEILNSFEKISYIESKKDKILENSEPYKYQKITSGKAINILCPIYNYHSGSYFLEKEALENFSLFSKKIIDYYL